MDRGDSLLRFLFEEAGVRLRQIACVVVLQPRIRQSSERRGKGRLGEDRSRLGNMPPGM